MWDDDNNLHDFFLIYNDYTIGDILTIKEVSIEGKNYYQSSVTQNKVGDMGFIKL